MITFSGPVRCAMFLFCIVVVFYIYIIYTISILKKQQQHNNNNVPVNACTQKIWFARETINTKIFGIIKFKSVMV